MSRGIKLAALMPDIVIRPANRTREDRDLVLSFHVALYETHRRAIMPSALEPLYAYRDLEAALRDDVEALLSRAGAVVLIAEESGRAIGYATGHIEDDPRRALRRKGVVEDWFVREQARGRGIGGRLLAALEGIFAEAGCEVLESTTWPFNQGARRAHLAHGFHEIEVKYRKRIAVPGT